MSTASSSSPSGLQNPRLVCHQVRIAAIYLPSLLSRFSGTQPHNPTAATHEREKFRQSRSSPGSCEFSQCRSIHLSPFFCSGALNRTIQLLQHMKEWRHRRRGLGRNSAKATAPLVPASLASVAPFICRPFFVQGRSTAQSNCRNT